MGSARIASSMRCEADGGGGGGAGERGGGAWAGGAWYGRLCSRSERITFFEIVESVCRIPVPSDATASNTVTPGRAMRRCSSSIAKASARSRLLYWMTSGTSSIGRA
jgi:hypothetical protein